jgi:formiminotetrahydrofolate cyclodeaminase
VTLIDRSVSSLLEAFRSSDPVPGGGSASALSGAIGASLLAMVAGLPKSRAADAGDAAELTDAGRRCTALARELAALVDRDSDAYETVMAAYKRPKGTDEEKAARSAAIQHALRSAIDAPLSVMRAADQALEQAATVARFGNPSASSDVQVGLELLGAGLRGAALNVNINLESIKDAAYRAEIEQEVERLSREAQERDAAARAALGAA